MSHNSVAIFWDYENCALPALEPSYTVVNKIRRLAHQYGSVKSFKAYLEYPEQPSVKTLALRSELQSCGVSLIDCPHNGRKDVADKMMMVDMMAHAIDTPAPSTIMLISGDRDFVYAVSILGLRQYRIVLLAPRAAHNSLKAQANAVYNWPEDFLPEPVAVADPAAVGMAGATHCRRPSKSGTATLEDFWKRKLPTPSPTISSISEPTLHPKIGDSGCSVPVKDALEPRQERNVNALFRDEPLSPQILSRRADNESLSDTSSSALLESAGSFEQRDPWRNDAKTDSPALTWGTGAQLPQPFEQPPSPIVPAGAMHNIKDYFSAVAVAGRRTAAVQPLNANASPFVHHSAVPSITPAEAIEEEEEGGADWQTYSRAAQKRSPQVPAAFKPLVKVLKRQLAEGVVHVESSQLGQFLSQEVSRLSSIYERAGVTRLKEYTALATEQGIVTLTREGADGHNYIALHPAYRRKAATLG